MVQVARLVVMVAVAVCVVCPVAVAGAGETWTLSTSLGLSHDIVICAPVTASGSFAEQYVSQNRSWSIWMDKLVAAGGMHIGKRPYDVTIVAQDCQSDATMTTTVSEALVANNNCTAMFAPYSSSLTPSAAAVAAARGVRVVAPTLHAPPQQDPSHATH